MVSDQPDDMTAEGIDVGLRYGEGKWSGVTATHLFDVHSLPVCSPDYLRKSAPIEGTADLVDHTLLNLDGAPHAREDWLWWLAESGVVRSKSLHILGFDSYANVIQAALDGQGIALGFSGVVDDMLARGQLVRPVQAELDPGYATYLVVPSGRRATPAAKSFFDWVLAEASQPTERKRLTTMDSACYPCRSSPLMKSRSTSSSNESQGRTPTASAQAAYCFDRASTLGLSPALRSISSVRSSSML